MSIDAKTVKALRDKTGAGMMDCKKALVESKGDLDSAVEFLRKSGVTKAEKKSVRDANEGLIISYIHHGSKLGVLLDIGCETDFVARTEGFEELANNIAMQIAATNPIAISKDDLSSDLIDKERDIYTEQAKSTGKPDNVVKKIVDVKIEKFIEEIKDKKILNDNGVIIIHRHKKEKDNFPIKFSILLEKYYGISKIIFGS